MEDGGGEVYPDFLGLKRAQGDRQVGGKKAGLTPVEPLKLPD